MSQHFSLIALVVRDYDEAIAWYRDALGFVVVEDEPQGDKRWVVMSPRGAPQTKLLLAKAKNEAQASRIGDQTGGRVFLFLHTDDFAGDHARLTAAGAHFIEQPRYETYGTVVVFEDLYGNRWDLIQPKADR